MKRKMLSLLTVFLMGSVALFAQSKTEKFEVKGNCGMCESRIEKAAKSVEGVSEADWDQKKQMVQVTFDEAKTDLEHIHMAIAKAGHDTDKHKAPDEVYENLPGCCKYDRSESKKEKMKEGHEGHDH